LWFGSVLPVVRPDLIDMPLGRIQQPGEGIPFIWVLAVGVGHGNLVAKTVLVAHHEVAAGCQLAVVGQHDYSSSISDGLLCRLDSIVEITSHEFLDTQAVRTTGGLDQVALPSVVRRTTGFAVVRELAIDLPAGRARARHPVDGVGRSKLAAVAAMTRLVLQVRAAPSAGRKKHCCRQEDGQPCDESLDQVSASRRLN
jgi:hypothetical protein